MIHGTGWGYGFEIGYQIYGDNATHDGLNWTENVKGIERGHLYIARFPIEY